MAWKKENKNIVYITRNKVMSTKHEEKVYSQYRGETQRKSNDRLRK